MELSTLLLSIGWTALWPVFLSHLLEVLKCLGKEENGKSVQFKHALKYRDLARAESIASVNKSVNWGESNDFGWGRVILEKNNLQTVQEWNNI